MGPARNLYVDMHPSMIILPAGLPAKYFPSHQDEMAALEVAFQHIMVRGCTMPFGLAVLAETRMRLVSQAVVNTHAMKGGL